MELNLKELLKSKIDLSYVAIDEVPEEYKKIIDKGVNKVGLISRAGNLKDIKLKEYNGHCFKSKSFQQNILLPNGEVYLCCMDYGLKHRLGNLKDTNFNNLDRKIHYELCRMCEFYNKYV